MHNSALPIRNHQWVLNALDQFESQLLRYALRLFDGDENRARDVVQHVFLKLCEQSPETLQGRLAPWLYSVCRHKVIDELRRAGKQELLADLQDSQTDEVSMSPAETIEQTDIMNFLRDLMSRLPGNQREALMLWCDGMTYADIATTTGKSIGAIRVLVHRGLAALKSNPEVASWLEQPATT
jgi:RNA polymerase sigma factor (sigma-70 family)